MSKKAFCCSKLLCAVKRGGEWGGGVCKKEIQVNFFRVKRFLQKPLPY